MGGLPNKVKIRVDAVTFAEIVIRYIEGLKDQEKFRRMSTPTQIRQEAVLGTNCRRRSGSQGEFPAG